MRVFRYEAHEDGVNLNVEWDKGEGMEDVPRVVEAINSGAALGPPRPLAGLPDDIRLARALETIEELRKRIDATDAALNLSYEERKREREELAVCAKMDSETISEGLSFRRAVAKVVGVNEEAVLSATLGAVERLAHDRDRLKGELTTAREHAETDAWKRLNAENNSLRIKLAERDQRLVEAGRTMAGMVPRPPDVIDVETTCESCSSWCPSLSGGTCYRQVSPAGPGHTCCLWTGKGGLDG